MRTRLSIFCDFDGTVSVRDVTDVLLETHALPQWRDIEALWRAGQIGSMECMYRQVALLRCSRGQLDALVDAVAIDLQFPHFVAVCREAAIPVTIVSDGLDYVIRRVLRNHGLTDLPVYANHLEMLGEDRYALSFPNAGADCPAASGTCKCAIMRRFRRPGGEAVLVGDGASDVCAAREAADFVFAKGSLLEYCRENNLPHAAYQNFGDVTRLLINPQRDRYDAQQRTAGVCIEGYPPHG
jgi:2-hydroxy-3-keto-5-methylthiopentenyl-1-phosphate phosphatase